MIEPLQRYGQIPLDRVDVRALSVWVIDLTRETGQPGGGASILVHPPHNYTLSVFAPLPGSEPVGEVILMWRGRKVSIVGHLTGKSGELTPDHLMAAAAPDGVYRAQLQQYLGT